MENNNFVVIMAGGSGTRLWPYSRENYPKQFLDLMGTGKSLLQHTALRFAGIAPQENILVVASQHYADIIKEQLPFLQDDFLLLEPYRRNTAPCVAYACQKIYQKNPQANIIITPADHLILQEEKFRDCIQTALQEATEKDALITLGIQPTRPDTGYGYIQFAENPEKPKSFKVKQFTEKPALEVAEKFVAAGDFLWNAGIFVWQAKTILQEFQQYLPEMLQSFQEIAHTFYTSAEKEALEKVYAQSPMLSIDYGIMEKTEKVWVVKSDFDWSDLGSWNALYEVLPKDAQQNAPIGDASVFLEQSQGNLVKIPKEKLAVLVGLENFAVIDHENVLFICPIQSLNQIKDFLNKAQNLDEKFI